MFYTKQSIEEEEKNKNSEKINKIERKKEIVLEKIFLLLFFGKTNFQFLLPKLALARHRLHFKYSAPKYIHNIRRGDEEEEEEEKRKSLKIKLRMRKKE